VASTVFSGIADAAGLALGPRARHQGSAVFDAIFQGTVMRRIVAPLALVLSTALAGCIPAAHQTSLKSAPAPAPKGPPRLIVAVSVDQFSADLFAQYRQHYTGGLARLLGGAVFPSGFQSHAATETCPGHSTLLTGVHPARTGIIANNWYDPGSPRGEKPIYCAEDERDPASSARNPVVSAVHLKVPTLGEMLKAANPASRNVAVSAKDRAVMMMGGHTIDAAYWWKGAGFVTLNGRTLSPAAEAANTQVAALLKAGAPALVPPAWCAPNDRAVSVGKATVGTGRFGLAPNQPDALRVSPRMDAATVDLANGLIDEMGLGKGAATDVLSVSLSATDYIGHATGTEGVEMCIQMAQLDQTLGRLFEHLDAAGIDYVVALSADHGGLDTPERSDQQAFPRAMRADRALMPADLSRIVAAKTGIATRGQLLIADGPFGDFYVNRELGADQRAVVARALIAVVKTHPQVAAAFTAEELASTPLPAGNPQDWTLKERARASFDPARSGDVVELLDRAVTPIPEAIPGMIIATHGSAFDYDRRVPMLFWRRGLPGFEQPQPVETVDIAPTLAALIGLKVPEGTFDGRCLDLDGGADNTCDAQR
jgi:predicted AlkP superfamily pyrophosphatase or phosphodiesterase